MSGEVLIEVRDLRKRFGSLEVLRGISFSVRRGDVTVIMGPSGCGKSTLLRCLTQLETPTSGEILLHGKRISREPGALVKLRTGVGMVFQHFHLFPHLNVLENLLLAPLVVRREPRIRAEQRAHELLAKVGLEDKVAVHPERLSGGQQQRVAIARCLMMEPEVILFDEPTSSLDPELVGEVLEVMRALVLEGRTMCVVTHEIGFARAAANRVLMLDEGRIVEEGPPERVLDRPEHPRTRQFLGRILR